VERQLVYSSMRTNKLYFILYKTIVYFLFRFLFPLASLTFLNFRYKVANCFIYSTFKPLA